MYLCGGISLFGGVERESLRDLAEWMNRYVFQIISKHTHKEELLPWKETQQRNGVKLSYTQCDSPLHDLSESLMKLLIS